MTGTIVHGKHLGHRLGYPTANLLPDDGASVPDVHGVYAAQIWIAEEPTPHWCMVNIGAHPTLPDGPPTIEAHILNYASDLYGRRARLELRRFLRAERRFATLEALMAQLAKDADATRAVAAGSDPCPAQFKENLHLKEETPMALIYGHRGASGYAPENTLEAFELAAKMGAHGVELDVHIAKDGQLVVAHDETIDRVADGTGLICQMTTSEMKKLRFNRTHPEYEKATIPTLEEVYALLRPTGLRINLELKNSRIRYEGLEEKCIDLADRMGMRDRILYSSFNHYSMMHIKQIDPSLPVGLLYDCMLIEPWTYAQRLGAQAIHPHFSELQIPGEGEAAHALGLQVNVWTVNTPEDVKMCLAAGADIIISNYPDMALAAARQN